MGQVSRDLAGSPAFRFHARPSRRSLRSRRMLLVAVPGIRRARHSEANSRIMAGRGGGVAGIGQGTTFFAMVTDAEGNCVVAQTFNACPCFLCSSCVFVVCSGAGVPWGFPLELSSPNSVAVYPPWPLPGNQRSPESLQESGPNGQIPRRLSNFIWSFLLVLGLGTYWLQCATFFGQGKSNLEDSRFEVARVFWRLHC